MIIAVDALCAFGDDLDRETVRHLLPYWRHFWELSTEEIEAVYSRFTDDDELADAAMPPRSGVVNPGGGYVSGTPAWPGSPARPIDRETDDRRDRR